LEFGAFDDSIKAQIRYFMGYIEIAVMLLAYQCLKWGDLDEGSRSFFAKKEREEYIAQREAELKKIKNQS
jgi:hypothetical protein